MIDPDQKRIIEAVRSRGSDARNLRDAAHEAHHALVVKVKPGKWDRESIHEALAKDRNVAELIAEELDARAVEQIVCRMVGVDPGTVEHWAMVCCMETTKTLGVALPGVDWVATRVYERMKRDRLHEAARTILELKPCRGRHAKHRFP